MTISLGSNIAIALLSTSNSAKNIQLPLISTCPGRIIYFKDIYDITNNSNSITLLTSNNDVFENSLSNEYKFTNKYQAITLYANPVNNNWNIISFFENSQTHPSWSGISSLSSIVSYGLSSLGGISGLGGPGISSLSSIVSYGLSSLVGITGSNSGGPGISSLSSIVSYGLSTVAGGSTNPGVSSLSSIVSYGLSSFSLSFTTSSLTASSFISPVTTTSSLTVSTILFGTTTGFVTVPAIQAIALSSIQTNTNILNVGTIATLASISSVNIQTSTIRVSYIVGISSIQGGFFIGDGSRLSNISVGGPFSSLSSIVSYGLSTVATQPNQGLSSLSSIVSYGLSSLIGAVGSNNYASGVSSLSSVVSYGLSTLSKYSTSIGQFFTTGTACISTLYIGSATSNLISSNIVNLLIQDTNGYAISILPNASNIDGSKYGITFGANNSVMGLNTNPQAAILVESAGAPGSQIGTQLQFYTTQNYSVGPQQRVVIDQNGYVGINTESPQGTLNVKGTTILDQKDSFIYLAGFPIEYIENSNLSNANFSNSFILTFDICANSKIVAAVGFDPYSSESRPLFSYDGINWNNGTILSGTAFEATQIYFANNIWIIPALFTTSSNHIFYSYDAINWYENSNAPALLSCIGVAYNDRDNYWLMLAAGIAGYDSLTSIVYTPDPTGSIFLPSSSGGFGSNGYGIRAKWSTDTGLWVVIGQDNTSNFNIQYGSDGFNWSYASNITFGGNSFFNNSNGEFYGGIDYGNKTWIAVAPSSDSYTMYISQDGINFALGATLDYNLNDIKYIGSSSWLTVSPTNSNVWRSDNNGANWYVFQTHSSIGLAGYKRIAQSIHGPTLTVNGDILTSNITVINNVVASSVVIGNYSYCNTVQSNPFVVIGSYTQDVTPIQYFTNAVVQSTNILDTILDVVYSEEVGTWVAVGPGGLYYSHSGINWTPYTNTFDIIQLNGVTYGNGLFVAVGQGGTNQNIIWSPDGVNWTQTSSILPELSTINSVVYAGSQWVLGVSPLYNNPLSSIFTTTDITGSAFTKTDITGSAFTANTTGGFDTLTSYIQYNGSNLYVAVGYDSATSNNIQYSSDRLNWYPANNVTLGGTQFYSSNGGYSIAYGNGVWMAGGYADGSNLYISSDGSNFSQVINSYFEVNNNLPIFDVKYSPLGNTWFIVTGLTNVLGQSYDNGSNWVFYDLSNQLIRIGVGIQILSNSTFVTSPTGTNLTVNGGLVVRGATVLTSAGEDILGIDDTTMVLICEISNSGISQYFLHNNIYNQNYVPSNGDNFTAFHYANRIWVGVTQLGNILYSYDGTNFNNANIQTYGINFYSTSTLNDVKYANNLWVTCGELYGQNSAIVYFSYDGINWEFNLNLALELYNSGAPIYEEFYCSEYNSNENYWVFGGYSTPLSNLILTIPDPTGFTVYPTNIYNSNIDIILSIKYNGTSFVATGFKRTGSTPIIYSYNSTNWYYASNVTYGNNLFFSGYGSAVEYGNGVWIVVGTDPGSYPPHSIYRSTDGSNFTAIGSNFEGLSAIKYDGKGTWYASDYSLNFFYKSRDNGTTWIAYPIENQPNGLNNIAIGPSPFGVPTETLIDGRVAVSSNYTGPSAFGTIHILPNPVNAASNTVGITFGANNYYSNGFGVEAGVQAGIVSQSYGLLGGPQSADLHFLTSSNFSQGAQECMTINSVGNVGINCNTPQFALDIKGSMNIAQNFFVTARQPRYFVLNIANNSEPAIPFSISGEIVDSNYIGPDGSNFSVDEYFITIVGFYHNTTDATFNGVYAFVDPITSNWFYSLTCISGSNWQSTTLNIMAYPVNFLLYTGTTNTSY
jgi:hypothetical protein